ncbi:MAG: dihydrofolate synthase [Nitriliruptorales bacterium]|nr:dihydrofolate synthase [Nitriliruptorales bacterium]
MDIPPDSLNEAAYAAAVAELNARQPSRMVPDLDRITTLAELLGRPERSYPSVQVTGTNGKTTTVAMISGLFGALGLVAGSYISPHLQDVRERIRIAMEPIPGAELAQRLAELAPFLVEVDARHPERVTYFEALTALAFTHFADAPVEVGVFEVGMGGRWDATNLVRGEVAVLTPISLDHPELGSVVEEIAGEKAGIIKDGAVVVSAAQQPDPARTIEQAAQRHGGQLVVAGRDFSVLQRRKAVGGQQLDLRGVTGEFAEVYLPLHGAHQATNAACALAAVEGFLGFAGGLDPEVVREGFAAVRAPGRLEVIQRDGAPTVVLDGAHNPGGARALASALREEFAFLRRLLVIGVLGDKDIDGIIAELAPLADHVVVTEPPSTRAADPDDVAKAVQGRGIAFEVADDVAEALERAQEEAAPGDGVIVTGSLYTVGAARDALGLPSG